MLKVAIIGLGLIGTSIGMALRNAEERDSPLGQIQVVGYDENRRATAEARNKLAIDKETPSLAEAVRDAQLVIIAVPVRATQDILRSLVTLATPGAVITDVSSTKVDVLAWAQSLLPDSLHFVGGHPMAGKELSGPAAAESTLFKEVIYCLCPLVTTHPDAVALVEAMVKQIGAKPYFIDPQEHDAYVGGVSHLPFLLSSALVKTVTQRPAWREMAPLAATGFRDITRLAAGSPVMHRDILATNREAMVHWINEMAQVLLDVRDLLEDKQDEELLQLFEEAQQQREEWLDTRPNMRPGEAEFENISGFTPERPNMFGFKRRPPR